MGPKAKSAVPALADVLSDHQMVSWPAADALSNIGPDASPAIPALVEVIEREQGKGKTSETESETPSTFSWLAGKALAGIGPASIPALSELLAHDDRFVRMTAAQALGAMEPPPEDAIPALNNALSDQHEYVRRLARRALDRIDKRSVAPDTSSGRGGFPGHVGALPARADPFPVRKSASGAQVDVQEVPIVWTKLAPYAGDPRNRPPGTVCLSFDDGYRWLIRGSVENREQRLDGERKVEVIVSGSRRYEHLLGTNEVRIIDDPRPKQDGRKGEKAK
jgi:hypothetical protein